MVRDVWRFTPRTHPDAWRHRQPSSADSQKATAINRETLTIFYIEGKSVHDVAETLDISEPAVKIRLHRARKALRRELERRLAENLEGLQPGAGLYGSVMAMLPAAPIGAGTGGGLTLVGKASVMLGKSWASLAMFPALSEILK
jgi:Sigma-70, region 4